SPRDAGEVAQGRRARPEVVAVAAPPRVEDPRAERGRDRVGAEAEPEEPDVRDGPGPVGGAPARPDAGGAAQRRGRPRRRAGAAVEGDVGDLPPGRPAGPVQRRAAADDGAVAVAEQADSGRGVDPVDALQEAPEPSPALVGPVAGEDLAAERPGRVVPEPRHDGQFRPRGLGQGLRVDGPGTAAGGRPRLVAADVERREGGVGAGDEHRDRAALARSPRTSTARPPPRGSKWRKRRPGRRNALKARVRSPSPTFRAVPRARSMARRSAAYRTSRVEGASSGTATGGA